MPTVVLVTGAAGFVGGHLIESLAQDRTPDRRVVAWHRSGGRPPADVANTTWQSVDLLDRAAVVRAIDSVRPAIVYHCAGAAHVGRSWTDTTATLAANVRGTHHLLEALRASGRPARV